MAVVPLHRLVLVIANVGSGVVAVVPLRGPVSVTADVGSRVVAVGVTTFDNRCWWWGTLNVSVVISVGFGDRLVLIWPFSFGECLALIRPFGFGDHSISARAVRLW